MAPIQIAKTKLKKTKKKNPKIDRKGINLFGK